MGNAVHVVCGYCQSLVRVPGDKLEQAPACPQCHEALLDGHPITLTAENFDKHVQRNDLPLVVDVWAPWCGPCLAMAPQFAAAAKSLSTQMRFAKLNSDQAGDIAGRLGIRSIPTVIVFHQGREVARQSGAMDSKRLEQWLRTASQAA